MSTIEERVALLEGRIGEQANMVIELRGTQWRLETRIDQRFDALEKRLTFQFHWLVGVQVTTLAAIVVTLATK